MNPKEIEFVNKAFDNILKAFNDQSTEAKDQRGQIITKLNDLFYDVNGDPTKPDDISMKAQIKKNKDMAEETQKKVDVMQPQHIKMWAVHTKFWVVVGVMAVFGAGFWKLVGHLFTKLGSTIF